MNFIKDKTQGFKSLAVWLPTLLSLLVVVLDFTVQTNLIPVMWIPVVVFVSGYIGRIIKQPQMRE